MWYKVFYTGIPSKKRAMPPNIVHADYGPWRIVTALQRRLVCPRAMAKSPTILSSFAVVDGGRIQKILLAMSMANGAENWSALNVTMANTARSLSRLLLDWVKHTEIQHESGSHDLLHGKGSLSFHGADLLGRLLWGGNWMASIKKHVNSGYYPTDYPMFRYGVD